jgi:hypothetical protein
MIRKEWLSVFEYYFRNAEGPDLRDDRAAGPAGIRGER